jgi:hypothetical protein
LYKSVTMDVFEDDSGMSMVNKNVQRNDSFERT